MITSERCLSPCCTCAEGSFPNRQVESWGILQKDPESVHCIHHEPAHQTRSIPAKTRQKNSSRVSRCTVIFQDLKKKPSGPVFVFTWLDPLRSPCGEAAAAWKLQAVKQVTPLSIPGNQKPTGTGHRLYLHRWTFRHPKQTAFLSTRCFISCLCFCGCISW